MLSGGLYGRMYAVWAAACACVGLGAWKSVRKNFVKTSGTWPDGTLDGARACGMGVGGRGFGRSLSLERTDPPGTGGMGPKPRIGPRGMTRRVGRAARGGAAGARTVHLAAL